jgi:magnesium-transporting ATPase (P-type)
MSRRGALAQQLNAIESLASVDTICLDKTGTLTEAKLRVVALEPAPGVEEGELGHLIGRFAASSPGRNTTLDAIAASQPGASEEAAGYVPFSSSKRWSGLRLGATSFVLGAPEHFRLDSLAETAAREAGMGRRVLAFGRTGERLDEDERPPAGLEALGLVVLSEELRPETRATVEFLRREGVELKVVSGDAPQTVAAIALDAGIPVLGEPLEGDRLPADERGLRAAAAGTAVVGRISPEGKKRLVEALREEGRYVAMVGDGVNDVPALKAARLGIAQGSGSEMARSVADVVLVRGDFAAIPIMVSQGRSIMRNIQRVTKLFVAKSAFAVFLILSVGLTETAYPLLPRHLTLAATLAVGIPSFFLALAPSEGPWKTDRFLREVSRFSIPAGTAAGLGVLSAYLFALNVVGLSLLESRTVATSVLVVVGLYLVYVLEATGRSRSLAVGALCAGLGLLYVGVLALGSMREFFELDVPGFWSIVAILGGTGLAVAGLTLTDDRFVPEGLRARLRF